MTFVILGTLAGWFTGRTLRTGDLVGVDVVWVSRVLSLAASFSASSSSLPAAECFSPLLLPRQAEPYRYGFSN